MYIRFAKDRMYYKHGDVVLVKIENYPFWPAEIARVHNGELYNVKFYGEKSEALVDASAVKKLTCERGKALQRQAILTKNKKLRVALRQAMKILNERCRDHQEGEDNFSQTVKCRQKDRIQEEQNQPKKLEYAKDNQFIKHDIREKQLSPQKMDIQASPSLQEQALIWRNRRSENTGFIGCGKQVLRNQYEYDSLRSLLKKYSLGLINASSYILSMEEREKMMNLLTGKELLLSKLVEYWIIEKICSVVNFVCFRGIPNKAYSKDIINILINYFHNIKHRVYSKEMDSFEITAQRRSGLASRVLETDLYLKNLSIVWSTG